MLHYFQPFKATLIILETKRIHSMTHNQNMSVTPSSILLNVTVSLTNIIVSNSPVDYQTSERPNQV